MREISIIINAAEELGYELVRKHKRQTHLRFVHPDTGTVVHTPCSPGKGRSLANTIADLKRGARLTIRCGRVVE